MSQHHYHHENWESLLGPVDDPVLQLLNQPDEETESLEYTQEEILRQQAFFGASHRPEASLVPAEESLLDDLVILAALFMDEGR